MENTNRDMAQDATPQNNWLDGDERFYAMYNSDDPDPKDEEENEEEEEDENKDWGHTDPAEGNSPFRDPMDPSGPGSAV